MVESGKSRGNVFTAR